MPKIISDSMMQKLIKLNSLSISIRQLGTLSLIGAIIIVVLCYNYGNFMEALVAEIAGNLLGIFIAIIIIDKYKKDRWDKARRIIYRLILTYLCSIAGELLTYLPIIEHKEKGIYLKIIDGKIEPNQITREQLIKLAKLLENSDVQSSEHNGKNFMESIIDYYRATEWWFDEIREILIPLLYQNDEDEAVINQLLEFVYARSEFNEKIKFFEDMPNEPIKTEFIKLMVSISNLYDLLYEKYMYAPKVILDSESMASYIFIRCIIIIIYILSINFIIKLTD